MRNLVTMGGEHQGIFGIPDCPVEEEGSECDMLRQSLYPLSYNQIIQQRFVPAQVGTYLRLTVHKHKFTPLYSKYWHDPLHEEDYAELSGYIADINNQGENKNETYKENLEKLDTFVMLKYTQVRQLLNFLLTYY